MKKIPTFTLRTTHIVYPKLFSCVTHWEEKKENLYIVYLKPWMA